MFRVEGGVLVRLHNRLARETLEADILPLCGIRHLRDGDLWNDRAQISQRTIPQGVETVLRWRGDSGEHQLVTRWQYAPDGDLVITQRAECASGGLVGMQWGLAVPSGWQLLLPAMSGFCLTPDTQFEPLRLEYPYPWEAQCVLIAGKHGGFVVYADDDAQHYKRLFVQRQGERLLVGLESWCQAPFEERRRADSVRWRVHVYGGHWLRGAAIYRRWMEGRFNLDACRRLQPDWVSDIQAVVIDNLDDPERLEALAHQLPPRQTLLYVPAWRARGYDRYYPDYTPRDGFVEQVRRAQALGFRVMLHVNYFGCHPEHPDYDELREYHHIEPFTHEPLYWEWHGEDPPIRFAYINPAARAWRERFIQRMVEVCQRIQPDALHLDQSVLMWNDGRGLVDGMNAMQGNLALHRELLEALPRVALSGEGLNEIAFRYESFAQRHVWGIDSVSAYLVAHHVAAAHPISSCLFTPHTRLYGYLGMSNPFGWRLYVAWRTAYERQGVLPTFAWLELEQLTQPDGRLHALLEEARWFAQHRPQPHYDPEEWRRNTLFLYRTADGSLARYYKTSKGTFLQVRAPKGWQTVAGRVEGVSRLRGGGNIPGWRAYCGGELFGLNPEASYPWSPKPPHRDALHLRSLSTHIRVAGVCVQEGQWACFTFEPTQPTEGEVEVFSLQSPVQAYLDGEEVEGRRLAPYRYRYPLRAQRCCLVLVFAHRAPLPLPAAIEVEAFPLMLEADCVVDQLVQYRHGMLPTVTPERRRRVGLFAHPLHDGRILRAGLVRLPLHAMLLHGAAEKLMEGVPLRLSVEVNGEEVWSHWCDQARQSLRFEASLAKWSGKLVLLRFIAQAPVNFVWSPVRWERAWVG